MAFKKYTIRAKTRDLLYEGRWWSISNLRKRVGLEQWTPAEIESKRKRTSDKRRYTAEAYERRKQQKREYHLRNKDRINENARVRRANWTDEQRRANSAKNWEARKKRPDYRKKWNDWYDRNKAKYCADESRRKWKRDPSRGLFKTADQFRRGEISLDEFNRRIESSFARLYEIGGTPGGWGDNSGLSAGERHRKPRKTDREPGEGET